MSFPYLMLVSEAAAAALAAKQCLFADLGTVMSTLSHRDPGLLGTQGYKPWIMSLRHLWV